MILKYTLAEEDFLDFQLFIASKSERINKKKRNGWILLTVGPIVVACYFYFKENSFLAIYFGLLAILAGVFYPKYFIWRYKKHYRNYIKDNYSNRFGEQEIIEIGLDSILSSDKTGEARINLSEIERVDETSYHFFVKVSTGHSLIIPKRKLNDIKGIRSKFEKIGLSLYDEQSWVWK